jgi:acyl carrier protein
MGRSEAEIAADVASVFQRVLGVDVAGPDADVRLGGHPAWDSLAHIDLVLAVEKAFGVSFATPEIPDLSSVSRVVQAVTRKLDGQALDGHRRA